MTRAGSGNETPAADHQAEHNEETSASTGNDISLDTVLTFLARQPDVEALLAAYPDLTRADLRRLFASASPAGQEPKMIRRRKGANQTAMARTHGLPAPDGTLHKGNIFRSLLLPLKPGKMLDLGSGKGNFSLSAAQMGWQVTAVDARTVRWPDADTEPDPDIAALIRSINWVQADVREFPIARREYDLICIFGLLHHLEVPDQLALLRRCAGSLLLIDTRIAPAGVDQEGPYEGFAIREHGETREEQDQVPTAAWGNPVSFRHTEESLVRLLRDAGYPQVLMMRPPHRRDYTFYLCLPRNNKDKPGDARGRKKKAARRGT